MALNLLPIFLAGGAVVVIASKKKKKKVMINEEESLHSSGTINGIEWRIGKTTRSTDVGHIVLYRPWLKSNDKWERICSESGLCYESDDPKDMMKVIKEMVG